MNKQAGTFMANENKTHWFFFLLFVLLRFTYTIEIDIWTFDGKDDKKK
jgi:hypothetical protein